MFLPFRFQYFKECSSLLNNTTGWLGTPNFLINFNLWFFFIFTIMVIIFWEILVFYQIFLSPQLKRSVIISNKHGIYKLPHKLPHDLRLRKLGKNKVYQNNLKTSRNFNLVSSFPPKININTSKILFENRNWTFPVVCYFTWKLEFVSNNLSMVVVYTILPEIGKVQIGYFHFACREAGTRTLINRIKILNSFYFFGKMNRRFFIKKI